MSERFIHPSEDIEKYFADEALQEASQDFFGLFMSMFSEARSIAVKECGHDVDYQIDSRAWQRGKWYVLLRYYRTRQGKWHRLAVSAFRWINTFIPAVAGYALSEIHEVIWLRIFVISVVIWALTFVLQDKLEADK